MERVLNDLVERLRKVYPNELVSVVLYGSAVVGEHHGRFSDYNVLCVLTEVNPSQLAASSSIIRWWREQGNPSPLLLSQHELKTSTDCFPIEFTDIKEHNRILHGADLVSDLTVDEKYYRAQVEHELRAKLLRLRQKAAAVLNDKDLMRDLLIESVSTFCVLFRHALRLCGAEAPMKKRDIIRQAQQQFGIDPAPFDSLLDVREGKLKPRQIDPGDAFAKYLKEIGVVIDAVDVLEK